MLGALRDVDPLGAERSTGTAWRPIFYHDDGVAVLSHTASCAAVHRKSARQVAHDTVNAARLTATHRMMDTAP